MARNPWYEPKPRERKPARASPRPAHRSQRQVELVDGLGTLQVCRCGAWRALVAPAATLQLSGASALWTDWSAPCTAPLPSPRT